MNSIENIIENLKKENRLLLEIPLEPLQGNIFQPTGFPEIGAATYERPDGTRMLVVESAQSMANHFEKTIIKENTPDLIDEFTGLSYIKIDLQDKNKTHMAAISSLTEAHRINSPYIISDKSFVEKLRKEAGYANLAYPDYKKIGYAFYHFDINSLIHGAFMSNVGGTFRVPRALSSYIVGEDIKEVTYGGVKFSTVDAGGKYMVDKGISDKSAYSNIPYPKTDYTAKHIIAYINLDISLIKSYELGDDPTNLLIALSLYKIRALFAGELKLRTACDLKVTDPSSLDNIPQEIELMSYIKELIQRCKTNMVVTQITAQLKENKKNDNNKEEKSSIEDGNNEE